METTNLGNIAVENFGVKRSRFPINRNNFSSCGFGEVQVTQCLPVDADTETSFSVENLTFVEPIVAPTYGHCSIKYWHYFVAMRDLFNDFDAFLAGTPIRKIGGLFTPKQLPHVPRGLLSTLLLWGAKATFYIYNTKSDGTKEYQCYRPVSTSGLASGITDILSRLGSMNTHRKDPYMDANLRLTSSWDNLGMLQDPVTFLGIPTAWLDARLLTSDYTWDGQYKWGDANMAVPLANRDVISFMDLSGMPSTWSTDHYGLDSAPVIIGNHDYLIDIPDTNGDMTSSVKTTGFAFAFRLSAFGKRLLKVMKGTGFQEDFTSTEPVSLMPLLATFKAYYECFGLLLYTNFESTACKKLLNFYEQYCGYQQNAKYLAADWTNGFYNLGNIPTYSGMIQPSTFQQFVLDLGALFVTDSQDVQSAHTINPAVVVETQNTELLDYIRNYPSAIGSVDAGTHGDSSSQTLPDQTSANWQQAFIDKVHHGQVDCELLQILYINTNHETIAGKRIAQLLELAGYGDWMARQKPRFIGYDEQAIEFNQVQSKADTLQPSGSGMILGERGGVGESYKYHKQHTFTNNETGFIITLCAVVPDSGYVNVLNPAYRCIEKLDFFNAQYDGVGQEVNKISDVIVGTQANAVVSPIDSGTVLFARNVTDESFGFAPTMTRHKFVCNIMNGVFAQNSIMDNFTPYSLDKVIKEGEIAVVRIEDSTISSALASKKYVTNLVFDPLQTPRAGLVYRYPTRYPWLGRLTRIFAAIGDAIDDGDRMGVFNMLMQGYENFNLESDGFVLLQTIRGSEWSHKLPITDSYETRLEGNKGKIDTNIGKA